MGNTILSETVTESERLKVKTHAFKRPMTIILDGVLCIEDIFDLPKLGAGHDGIVFKYGNLALKLLKYDITTRKERKLMTFQKANFFKERLHSKRLVRPKGILLDEDGIYCGYTMDALDDITKKSEKKPGDFTVQDLHLAIDELERDVEELTQNRIAVKDLNRGSYIFTSNFMQICDMDKFIQVVKYKGLKDINLQALNFIIAKFFLYQIQKMQDIDEKDLKILRAWIKRCITSNSFLDTTREEIEDLNDATIDQYLDIKKDMVLSKTK